MVGRLPTSNLVIGIWPSSHLSGGLSPVMVKIVHSSDKRLVFHVCIKSSVVSVVPRGVRSDKDTANPDPADLMWDRPTWLFSQFSRLLLLIRKFLWRSLRHKRAIHLIIVKSIRECIVCILLSESEVDTITCVTISKEISHLAQSNRFFGLLNKSTTAS